MNIIVKDRISGERMKNSQCERHIHGDRGK